MTSFVKQVSDCPEFVAGDATILREILHPDRHDVDLDFSIAYAKLEPGMKSYPHKLSSTEIYLIINGEGLVHFGRDNQSVEAGSVVFIQPNDLQWIENTGDQTLVFYCIVRPHWQKEDESVLR